jgi:proteasome lid subunit RPN8/RPN11
MIKPLPVLIVIGILVGMVSGLSGPPDAVLGELNNSTKEAPVEYSMSVGLVNGTIVYTLVDGMGTHNNTVVNTTAILMEAQHYEVHEVMLVHNHPNHACYPSEFDTATLRGMSSDLVRYGITLRYGVILCGPYYTYYGM